MHFKHLTVIFTKAQHTAGKMNM